VGETRKLAAILVSDVVGYSRLAGADEDRILARLRTLRSDLIDPTIAVHHGRIVKRTGDGSIIEFRSVVDAVNCAIEIQRAMVERNAGVASDKRIEFRVGIHLGDVVEESDGDLMGDGVNIAARLEGICEPGAICLSEDAYRQVKSRLELQVADLGQQTLKNVAEPVHAYLLRQGPPMIENAPATATMRGPILGRWRRLAALLVALLAIGGYAWHAGYAPRLLGVPAADTKLANAPRLSIVVLPFENLSGDKEQDYFADGITDDLTTDLSHLPDSFVISRGTAFTYKGKPVDDKQIGRELGVRYVLEGSVGRVGETITVNAQLIATETGAHVWANRFDGERGKLGELQVEVVSRLANSLGVELVKAEALRAARERPDNPDAVDLAMRGDAARFKSVSAPDQEEALGYYERALRLDPNLVRAQVGVATGLTRRVILFKTGNPAEDLPRAEALAMNALSAEPDNPRAHQARASVMFAKNQFSGSLAELRGVIENNPNLAWAHADYGANLTFNGQAAEAIPQIETALRLSPRDPELSSFEFNMCSAYTHLAQWEKTVEWCKRSIATRPSLWLPYMHLAAANGWLGRDAEAKTAVADLLKLRPGFTVQQFANMKWSDNPQYQREYARIVEGLRKAGVPEGDKKAD
jgi:adenylate cyclase